MASQDAVLESSWRVSLEWAIEEVPLTADDLLGDAEAMTTDYEDDADEDVECMKAHASEEEEDDSVNEEGSMSLDEEEAEAEEEDGDELADTRVSVGLWQITSRRSCVGSHRVTSDEASSDVNELFGIEIGEVLEEVQGSRRSCRGGEDDIRPILPDLAAGGFQNVKGGGAQAQEGGDMNMDRGVKAAHAEIEAGLALQGGRVSSRQRRWLNLEGAKWSHLPSADEDVEMCQAAAAPPVLDTSSTHTTLRPTNTKSNMLMRCPKRFHMWVPVSVIVAAMPACESPALRTQPSRGKTDGLEARIKVHEKIASTEMSRGNYLEAIESVENNLMMRVKFGPESPNELLYMFLGVVYLCNAYAVECIHRQDLRQARNLLDRAKDLTRKKILKKCKVTELVRVGLCAATFNTLASLHRRQGNSAAAFKALHKALSVIRKHRSGLEVVEAASLLNMSAVLLLDGSSEDAVTMSRAAIDLLQAHRPEAEQAWEREFKEPTPGCSGRCARLTALWAMVAAGHFNYGMGLIGVGGRALGVTALQEAARVSRTYLDRDSDISLQIDHTLTSLAGANTKEPSRTDHINAAHERPIPSDKCESPSACMQYAAPYVHWGHPPSELKQILEMKAKSRTDPRRNRRRHPSGLVPKLLAFEDIPRVQGLTHPSQRPLLAPAGQSIPPLPESKVMPDVAPSVTATRTHSSCTSAPITKATSAGTTARHVTGPSPRSLRISVSPTQEDQLQAQPRPAQHSPSPPPGARTPSPPSQQREVSAPPGGHIPKPPRQRSLQSPMQGHCVPTPPTQRKVKDARSSIEEQPGVPTLPPYSPAPASSHMPCAPYVTSSREKAGPTSGNVLHDVVARTGAGGRGADAASPAHSRDVTRPACIIGFAPRVLSAEARYTDDHTKRDEKNVGSSIVGGLNSVVGGAERRRRASEAELQVRLNKVYDIEVPARANVENKMQMPRAPLVGRNGNLQALKPKRAGSDLSNRDLKERGPKEGIERSSSAGSELQAISITAWTAARPRPPPKQMNPVGVLDISPLQVQLGRMSLHGRILSARNMNAAPTQSLASAAPRHVR